MKEEIEYLYIMDYTNCGIYKLILTSEYNDKEVDEILKSYGFDSDTCSFMYSTKNLVDIEELKKEKDY